MSPLWLDGHRRVCLGRGCFLHWSYVHRGKWKKKTKQSITLWASHWPHIKNKTKPNTTLARTKPSSLPCWHDGTSSSLHPQAWSVAGMQGFFPDCSCFHVTNSSMSVGKAWCWLTTNSDDFKQGHSPCPLNSCQVLGWQSCKTQASARKVGGGMWRWTSPDLICRSGGATAKLLMALASYCFRDCWKRRVCAIWLKIAPMRVTWMEDHQESVSFDNGLGESADLEWRLCRGRCRTWGMDIPYFNGKVAIIPIFHNTPLPLSRNRPDDLSIQERKSYLIRKHKYSLIKGA